MGERGTGRALANCIFGEQRIYSCFCIEQSKGFILLKSLSLILRWGWSVVGQVRAIVLEQTDQVDIVINYDNDDIDDNGNDKNMMMMIMVVVL